MGRGLSDLQRTILEMGRERIDAEGRDVAILYSVYAGPAFKDESPEKHELREKLRRLVPEAFEYRLPDGTILTGGIRLYVGNHMSVFNVGKFSNGSQEAEDLAQSLRDQGVDAYTSWRVRNWDNEKTLGADVWACEVLERAFGFEPEHRSPVRWGQHLRFSEVRIGKARYNAARASVARAFKRLADRGLVVHGYGWVCLTVDGLALAEELSVKGRNNRNNINQYAVGATA